MWKKRVVITTKERTITINLYDRFKDPNKIPNAPLIPNLCIKNTNCKWEYH